MQNDNGQTFLLVRFTTEAGDLRTSVGPFQWPPASIGGALEVIYDPQDLTNVTTPGQMTSGRTSLTIAICSGVLLILCILVMLIDFAG
ncbi:hypothetical protein FE633_25765 [Streptomyces montanus]|uniref:DUF3592 domain-containing protein n=1 Tax=Streptomyces montanus TaxID=2580423 RepID=A0A5R9FHR5_9ACTN|nr:hypothetical protein [Streptomyces montanus]TLS43362.1 hypothetical protein FE633_25765 [Streptomyces montanus]